MRCSASRRWSRTTPSRRCARTNEAMLGELPVAGLAGGVGALAGMEPLAERLGVELEGYLSIYGSRIAYFRENPPDEQWDGVYVAATK